MEKQQNAPVQEAMLTGDTRKVNPIWQRWFQKLASRDDEIRRKPYKIYTTNQNLTTWDFGKTILFDVGASVITCNLPSFETKDKWAWVQIVRFGTGRMIITADPTSRIEYSSLGGSIYCEEKNRKAANVELQIISVGQWAITAGLGIWDVD